MAADTRPRGRGPVLRARLVRPVAAVAVAAAAVGIAPFLSSYPLFVLGTFLVTLVAAVGLNIVMGYAGQVSLGHAGFVAVGAYTVAVALESGVPYPLALILGMATAGLVGYLLGMPSLKLSPLYLAMVTFAFGEAVRLVALNWLPVTGGPNGLTVPGVTFFGVRLDSSQFFGVLVVCALLAVAAAANLTRTRPGRALRALRESPVAAQASGVALAHYKTSAFAISAVLAGLAGGLYAGLVGFVNPDAFTFAASLLYVTMNVVGGMGSIAGATVGAAVFTALPEALSGFAQYSALVSAALLVIFILAAPRGIVEVAARLRAHRRAEPAPVDPTPDAALPADEPAVHAAVLPASRRTSMERSAVFTAQDVSLSFGGNRALDQVGLTVGRGQIHALIGPNGSGKTTLINVVTGINRPDAGAVRLGEHDLLRARPQDLARIGVARTFQNLQLFSELSVLENVLVGMHARINVTLLESVTGLPRSRRAERAAAEHARDLVAWVGLGPYQRRPAGSLPLGHQRLLEIARALACDPVLLALDEPGAGLTSGELDRLGGVLDRIRAEWSVGMLLVGHTMALLMSLADAATALDGGQVIAQGTPDAVTTHPDVVAAYLGRSDVQAP